MFYSSIARGMMYMDDFDDGTNIIDFDELNNNFNIHEKSSRVTNCFEAMPHMLCSNAFLECIEEKPKHRLSIEEPPTPKLNTISSNLQYAFLGDGEILLVIYFFKTR